MGFQRWARLDVYAGFVVCGVLSALFIVVLYFSFFLCPLLVLKIVPASFYMELLMWLSGVNIICLHLKVMGVIKRQTSVHEC